MNYIILILVGACVGLHLWMMSKKSKSHKEQNTNDEHKKNKHGGCCH